MCAKYIDEEDDTHTKPCITPGSMRIKFIDEKDDMDINPGVMKSFTGGDEIELDDPIFRILRKIPADIYIKQFMNDNGLPVDIFNMSDTELTIRICTAINKIPMETFTKEFINT